MVGGLQLGKVWIGVQPALGLEGDPMRLLFERDLTPHPQYAAFYKWLHANADAVCHLGARPLYLICCRNLLRVEAAEAVCAWPAWWRPSVP